MVLLILKIIGLAAFIANVMNSEPYRLLTNYLSTKVYQNSLFNKLITCPLCLGFYISIIPSYILSNGDIILFISIVGLIPILAELITRELQKIRL